MALPGEFEYYSSRSGLPAGTLDDHKLAYFELQVPTASDTLPGMEYAFYEAQLPGVQGTLDDLRLEYYRGKAGAVYGSGSVTDFMLAFFANPTPPASAGYGLGPYGTMPYGQ